VIDEIYDPVAGHIEEENYCVVHIIPFITKPRRIHNSLKEKTPLKSISLEKEKIEACRNKNQKGIMTTGSNH
jgi:hypothetical protein